jgi:hypothetical protein
MTLPDRPAPDVRHPSFCDPDQCLAGDPVASSHRSAPVRLERKHLGDTTVVAQVWMTADEPIEVATPILALTFDRSDYLPNVASYEFDAPVAVALLDALMSLRHVVLGGS